MLGVSCSSRGSRVFILQKGVVGVEKKQGTAVIPWAPNSYCRRTRPLTIAGGKSGERSAGER